MANRVLVVKLKPVIKPAGVKALESLAGKVPVWATDVRVLVTSRWGKWDGKSKVAKQRAVKAIKVLKDHGVQGVFASTSPKVSKAAVKKWGALSVRIHYNPPTPSSTTSM